MPATVPLSGSLKNGAAGGGVAASKLGKLAISPVPGSASPTQLVVVFHCPFTDAPPPSGAPSQLTRLGAADALPCPINPAQAAAAAATNPRFNRNVCMDVSPVKRICARDVHG